MKQNKRSRYERNISNKFLFGKRISMKNISIERNRYEEMVILKLENVFE